MAPELLRGIKLLIVGGSGEVVAFRASDGEEVWRGEVDGEAYGLAISNGRLFVSTSKGVIHCFAGGKPGKPRVIGPPEGRPYPDDRVGRIVAEVARRIADEAGVEKGYCLVLGCLDGRLAYELAKSTELKIIVAEEDEGRVRKARRALDESGLYGVRVVVHRVSFSRLPYTDYMMNLVVSERTLLSGELPVEAEEVLRVLRPYGGTAYIGRPAELLGRGRKLSGAELRRWLEGVVSPEAKAEIRESDKPDKLELIVKLIFDFKIYLYSFTFSNPVFLHCLYSFRPVGERVKVI